MLRIILNNNYFKKGTKVFLKKVKKSLEITFIMLYLCSVIK